MKLKLFILLEFCYGKENGAMKILWECNIALPQIANRENLRANFGGGWLVGLLEDWAKNDDIHLTVCFPCSRAIASVDTNPAYFSFNPKSSCEYFREMPVFMLILHTTDKLTQKQYLKFIGR